MSSQKKVRGLMKEGPLVQMLDRQRVQQAAADEAKKLVDAAALASERLVDATKEAEETATAAAAAAAAAALSAPEEAQVSLGPRQGLRRRQRTRPLAPTQSHSTPTLLQVA